MVGYRIFPPAPNRCWDCGSPTLRVVSDGFDTDFVCDLCGTGWHLEFGRATRIERFAGTVIDNPDLMPDGVRPMTDRARPR